MSRHINASHRYLKFNNINENAEKNVKSYKYEPITLDLATLQFLFDNNKATFNNVGNKIDFIITDNNICKIKEFIYTNKKNIQTKLTTKLIVNKSKTKKNIKKSETKNIIKINKNSKNSNNIEKYSDGFIVRINEYSPKQLLSLIKENREKNKINLEFSRVLPKIFNNRLNTHITDINILNTELYNTYIEQIFINNAQYIYYPVKCKPCSTHLFNNIDFYNTLVDTNDFIKIDISYIKSKCNDKK